MRSDTLASFLAEMDGLDLTFLFGGGRIMRTRTRISMRGIRSQVFGSLQG